ncbi:hypothetical protein HYW55_00480 [Candidatus Gottesmanbacteria bacterium]|nr:hypothetical protein [Candidatus Gottesmanbacteria bacterium]
MFYTFAFLFIFALAAYVLSIRYIEQHPGESGMLTFPKFGIEGESSWKGAATFGILLLIVLIVGVVIMTVLTKIVSLFNAFFALMMISMSLLFVSDYSNSMAKLVRHRTFGLIIQIGLALFLGLGWLIAPSWPTYDVAAFIAIYVILRNIGPVRLRYLLLGFAGIMIYDVWGVLGSGLISGIVMGKTLPPLLILVPDNLFSVKSQVSYLLGAGDLLVGGIAVMTARKYHIEKYVFLGFAVGLFLAPVVTMFIRVVPATVPIAIPVLIAFLIAMRIKKISPEW